MPMHERDYSGTDTDACGFVPCSKGKGWRIQITGVREKLEIIDELERELADPANSWKSREDIAAPLKERFDAIKVRARAV